MMKWTHLPNAGGLYDQHPKMLDDFLFISSIEAKAEKRRMDKEKAKNKPKGSSGRRSAGRRR